MPKEEWGVKRVCPTTGKRFYDLGKDPIISPYTGEVVVLDTGKTSRSLTADKADKATEKAKAAKEVLDDDSTDLEDEAEISLDDDLLDDDEEEDNVPLEDIADVASESDDDN